MELSPKKKRKSKHKRQPRLGNHEMHLNGVKRHLSLTERDKQVLLSLYFSKCLTSHQIRDLHFQGLGQAEVVCRRRLRSMFDDLLIDRFFVDVGEGNGTSPQHVVLDELGAKVVAGLLGEKHLSRIKWSRDMKDSIPLYAAHITGYNQYWLDNVLRARELGHEVTDFRSETFLFCPFHYRNRDYHFTPDARFTYWAGEEGLDVLLEWDRGTMGPKAFKEKVGRYEAFYLSGEYEARLETDTFPLIITVAPDWERCERLKRVVEETGDLHLIWRFTVPSELIFEGVAMEAGIEETVRIFE